MRLTVILILFLVTCLLPGCGKVDPAPVLQQSAINETEDTGQLRMNLTWSVNGKKDDGMLADLSLYLSHNKGDLDDEWSLDESLNLKVSGFDYHGGQSLTPSALGLYDFQRYFIGVAFSGVLPNPKTPPFPMVINYSIELFYEKSKQPIRTIVGEFKITSDLQYASVIDYVYTLDILTSAPEDTHRNYILQELAKPIHIVRENDVIETTEFPIDKPLYIEMIWSVNGESAGYEKVDMDLFVHDINNSNVSDSQDLDFYSARTGSYEKISIASENGAFQTPLVPEKVGFYFFEKLGNDPSATIDYMYKVYCYDGNIYRHTSFGSFTSPPQEQADGSFYFGMDIKKSGSTYKVKDLDPVLQWTP